LEKFFSKENTEQGLKKDNKEKRIEQDQESIQSIQYEQQ